MPVTDEKGEQRRQKEPPVHNVGLSCEEEDWAEIVYQAQFQERSSQASK
jgi:hypothetical protein